jgi:protein SCO1/2
VKFFDKGVLQIITPAICVTAATAGVSALMVLALSESVYARNFEQPRPGLINETPKQLEDIGISEHLGERVDLGLTFKNEKGELVTLGSYIRDGKPLLLSLAYYNCPSLCNFHLNGVLDAFKGMKEPVGKDFNYVVVSIDAKETPDLAAKKKANYMSAYGRPEGANGWHFLVGGDAEIQALASQVGFKFRWDEEQKQWAHAAAAIVLTPDGRISRYLYGIVFEPRSMRLSLVEASNGKIGTLVDKLVLYCFHFDPKTGKYSLAAFNAVRLAGMLVVAILVIFLAPFWFRQRREKSGDNDFRRNPSLQGES